MEPQRQPSPTRVIPEGMSLHDWIESRVARFATRTYDWQAHQSQVDVDPKYRRAQLRYIFPVSKPPTSAEITSPNSSHFSPLKRISCNWLVGAKSVGEVLILMPGSSTLS